MKIVEKDEIAAVLDEAAALAAIRQAFMRFAEGRATIAAVGHLHFTDPPGDCHIKSARIGDDPMFVVKVGSSFYDNPKLGLSSSQGGMMLFRSDTGEALGMLNDGGYLTDMRTALTGMLVAQTIGSDARTLGIVGTGIQARLHAMLAERHCGFSSPLIWGRNRDAAKSLAQDVGGEAVELEALCARADLIITTTPATEPLLLNEWIRPGARIIAVGADSPGKRELDPAILGRARVIVDSAAQCLHHGESYWAVEAGLLDPAAVVELGTVLASPVAYRDDEIVVADLTGVAIQDAAISASVWEKLESPGAA